MLLQMFPIAVTCGNTFVLKPSEKDPGDYRLRIHVILYKFLEHCPILRRETKLITS